MARIPSDQGKDSGPGVVDIWGDIKEVFAEPPETNRRPERITGLAEKHGEADGRYQKLAQGSAEGRDETPKGTKQDVAEFMEGEVDKVQQVPAGRIVGDPEKDKLAGPDDHNHENDGPGPGGRAVAFIGDTQDQFHQ
jgi:hypothetical protein